MPTENSYQILLNSQGKSFDKKNTMTIKIGHAQQ